MIYNLPQLPKLKCDAGCGQCCGPVIVSSDEYKAIETVIAALGITPQRNGIGTCPLYINGKCSVYHARPMLCRLFGHVPGMACAKGYDTPASDHVRGKWNNAVRRSAKSGVRMLHELAYTNEEIQAGLKEMSP